MFKLIEILDSGIWGWKICWPRGFCTVNPNGAHPYSLSGDNVALWMIAYMDCLMGLNPGLLQGLMEHVGRRFCCAYYSGGQGKMEMSF
jgi:hypothetical protein